MYVPPKKALARQQASDYMFDKTMRECATARIVTTYKVVEKGTGRVVKSGVPLEYIAQYGKAARLYRMEPIN